ncbi:FAD-dependent oxidoreductase [Pseudonocardia alni]|uniref:FAD-dependent oxidoreductase n=1 Tax=Pseudonocardia alni TaxID=33907 RepID=UPI0027A4DC5F|nr:NAD(P)-binding protein [Pseudonocardia alni]
MDTAPDPGDNPGPTAADAVVLGAGISGLVSASILHRQGARHVVVLDEYPHVGGNHIDHHAGGYTFDVGSLVFQDDSPLVAHFPEVLPRYTEIDPSWGKLTPQGTIARYPFSVRQDVLAAGAVECARIGLSVARARLRRRPLETAGDFARYWIGPRLLRRSGLENYMERFCGLPADRIDLNFARQRMLWISEHARLGNVARLLRIAREENVPEVRTNTQLARPQAGFAHLYEPAVERLERSGTEFRLGTRTQRVRRDGDGFVVEHEGGAIRAGRVISTIPVDRARELCGIPAQQPLPTVTLVSLYYSFAGDRGFTDPILYNFSHSGAWKRLTVYSDFYRRAHGREYFGVEVITGPSVRTPADADTDFRRHTMDNGLFTGDLRLEGEHVLDHAYPIYTGGAADRAAGAVAELRRFGLESFGRQGAFEYQPTARVSTVHAERALGATTV